MLSVVQGFLLSYPLLFKFTFGISHIVYSSCISFILATTCWTPKSAPSFPCARTRISWTRSTASFRTWSITRSPLHSTSRPAYRVKFHPLPPGVSLHSDLCSWQMLSHQKCFKVVPLPLLSISLSLTGFGFNGLWRFAGPFSKVWLTAAINCLFFSNQVQRNNSALCTFFVASPIYWPKRPP